MPWVPRARRCALPVQGACAKGTADLGFEGRAGVCQERKEVSVTAKPTRERTPFTPLRVQLGPWELPGVEKILARSPQPLRALLGQPHGALSESSRARGTLGGHHLCDWGDL